MHITYSLLGPAVDEGLFSVGPKNGYVKIHGILDREKAATYEVSVSSQHHLVCNDSDGSGLGLCYMLL